VARVIWRSAAVDALQEIDEYIRRDSLDDAVRVVSAIASEVENASRHPESGSIVLDYDDPRIRERLTCGFRIIYRHRPEHDVVEVVLIRRQTRRLPRRLD